MNSRKQRSNTAILITTNNSPRDTLIRFNTASLANSLSISISELGRAALESAIANPSSILPFIQSRRRGPSPQ